MPMAVSSWVTAVNLAPVPPPCPKGPVDVGGRHRQHRHQGHHQDGEGTVYFSKLRMA